MFEIKLQNINAATENLFGQIEGWSAVLNEVNDCLYEVKNMSLLWQETSQLKKCAEFIRETINELQHLTDGLVKIRERYGRSDETGAEYAESILQNQIVSTFSEVKVPQYEDGIIHLYRGK